MKKTKNEQELLALLEEEAQSSDKDAKDVADAQPQSTKNKDEDTDSRDIKSEFDQLIKGEFKEQFEQKIKDILKRRFKDTSSNQADAKDPDSEPIYELKEKLRILQEENDAIKSKIEEGYNERKRKSTLASWIKDADTLKESYPDFDLAKECENPLFLKFLQNGIDLKSAYYAVHHEDIIDEMKKRVKEDTGRKITDSIRARGARPVENGLSGKSTAVLKTDVSKLTAKERAEIAKRVMRGEEIRF